MESRFFPANINSGSDRRPATAIRLLLLWCSKTFEATNFKDSEKAWSWVLIETGDKAVQMHGGMSVCLCMCANIHE